MRKFLKISLFSLLFICVLISLLILLNYKQKIGDQIYFYKDFFGVYYWSPGGDFFIGVDNNYTKLEEANPFTFRVISRYLGADEHNGYFESNIIPGVDPTTLTIVGSGENYHSKDKNNVYFKTTPIIGADPNTFSLIDLYYSKDNASIFLGSHMIPDSDANTFQVYEDSGYSKDKNNIYYLDSILSGADRDSFTPLFHRCYRNREEGSIYEQGNYTDFERQVADITNNTGSVAFDKDNFYYSSSGYSLTDHITDNVTLGDIKIYHLYDNESYFSPLCKFIVFTSHDLFFFDNPELMHIDIEDFDSFRLYEPFLAEDRNYPTTLYYMKGDIYNPTGWMIDKYTDNYPEDKKPIYLGSDKLNEYILLDGVLEKIPK